MVSFFLVSFIEIADKLSLSEMTSESKAIVTNGSPLMSHIAKSAKEQLVTAEPAKEQLGTARYC